MCGLTTSCLGHNKPLVPIRTGKTPVLAAQRRRWASRLRFLITSAAISFVLFGCAYHPIAVVTPEVYEAVQSAELFVARHGFTSVGHPPDKPIEQIGLMDSLYGSNEEMLAARRGSLEARAFGISIASESAWYVLFKSTDKAADSVTAVFIERGQAPHMIHAPFRINSSGWRRLPPNHALNKDAPKEGAPVS